MQMQESSLNEADLLVQQYSVTALQAGAYPRKQSTITTAKYLTSKSTIADNTQISHKTR